MTFNPSKKSDIKVIKKESSPLQNSGNFLNNLDPNKFSFLPESLIVKFKYILFQYKKILGINVN